MNHHPHAHAYSGDMLKTSVPCVPSDTRGCQMVHMAHMFSVNDNYSAKRPFWGVRRLLPVDRSLLSLKGRLPSDDRSLLFPDRSLQIFKRRLLFGKKSLLFPDRSLHSIDPIYPHFQESVGNTVSLCASLVLIGQKLFLQ